MVNQLEVLQEIRSNLKDYIGKTEDELIGMAILIPFGIIATAG